MAATVGALRVTLGANTANFEAGMKRARREAQSSATAIQRSLSGIKSGIGGLATGIVAGLSIGVITDLAKRGLDYAASLGEVAQQLGVTTEALQVYRYAGSQVGLTNEQIEGGLQKLTRTAGEAAEGSKAAAEAFNKLGVNVLDVNGKVKDTDRLMREVADGLSKIEDPARRAAIEVDLFGRAGQKLDTLLAGGSKAIDELRDAAHRLGIVLSEEQIQRADETADKLAALKQVLEARIAGTVADNAAAILELANALSEFVNWVLKGTSAWLNFTKTIGGGSSIAGFARLLTNPGQAAFDAARRGVTSRSGEVGVGQLGTSVTTGLGPIKPFQPAGATGLNRIDRKGDGPKGPSAESLAEQARRKQIDELQRSARIERDIADAKDEELRAQQNLIEDYVDRAEIERQLIDSEINQRNASLDLELKIAAIEGTADAQLRLGIEQQKSLNERLRILRKQEVAQEVELDRQRDFEDIEQTRFGIQRDMLQAQSALAETAAERRRVELQILDLAYRERKERLERILQESKDWKEIEQARMELAALPGQRAADTAGLLQSTRGPLEQYQTGLPTTAEKMNEALQNVAVNGLQALEDGILSVIDGTKSLADAFRDMASQIIAELLRIQIQKMIIGPVSNMLGGLLNIGASAIGGGITGTGSAAFGSAVGNAATIDSVFGFSSGGFTGFMPRKKVAGFVHGQEYVFDAAATNRIGVHNLERIRKGLPAANSNIKAGDTHYNMPIQIPPGMTPKQARDVGAQFAAGFQSRVAMAKRQGF